MFTCCPHCQTCFRITKAQLDVAQGQVRCGHCKEVFNGKQHLRESIAAQEPVAPPTTPPLTEPTTPTASQPKTDGTSTKSEATEFDTFDLNSIPESNAEEMDWPEEKEEPAADFVVVESDEWLDDEEDDDVTLNLDMDDYEAYEEEANHEEGEDEFTDADEAEQSDNEAASRYAYIEDEMPQEQQDIDQFIAEVNAQLEEAIAEPEKSNPFQEIIDKEKDEPQTPKVQVEPVPEPPVSRTDDEFKKAFLANLDSGLELEPKNPELPAEHPSAEQAAPEPEPVKPVFPPIPEAAEVKTEPEADLGPVDEILTTAQQPPTRSRPTRTEEIPFHLRDSLVVEEKQRSPIKLILTIMGLLLFSMLLLAQLAYFRSSQLVDRVPAMQFMVEKFCNKVPCVYSGPRDVSQIKLQSRDIRLHPKVDNALLISATFINRASFKQPYPNITITLSDLSGAMVAQRQFKPAEYLGRLNSPFLLMPSGKPVQIALEVVDPGKDAVNFEFTFQ